MPEVYEEIQRTKESDMSSLKKFSKLRLLQMLGLLNKKFNYETNEFESSWSLNLFFYLALVLKMFTIKFVISYYFPKSHIVQLFLGSFFNYLDEDARFFMGLAGVMSGLWTLLYHIVFNHLNARNDYRLLRFWMKLTLELPVNNDRDYRVFGLSREENKQFWSKEKHFNYIWFRVVNWYTVFLSLTFSSQLFFVRFDGVEIVSFTYFLFQTIHILYIFYCVNTFMHDFYSINLFYMTCMRFFSKRFAYIGRHVKYMNLLGTTGRIDNRKLSRLIVENNKVHHDLILINDFFKFYVGFNLLAFFAFGIIMLFVVLLDIDWRFKLAIFSVCFFLYLSVIYFPFIMAKWVRAEINMTTRHLENTAFYRQVNLPIRQKIESLSNLSDKTGFTVFDWFQLDPFTGLKISLEFAVGLLLLIQTYYYYTVY